MSLIRSSFSEGVGNNDYADRFPAGEFVVALDSYVEHKGKDGVFYAVEFIILQSENPGAVGVSAGEAFFIEKTGWAGKYQKQRFNALNIAIAKSLGAVDTAPEFATQVADTIEAIVRPAQVGRGLILKATAKEKHYQDANKNDKTAMAVTYTPLIQTKEQITTTRARLDELKSQIRPTKAAPVAAPAVAAATAPAVATATAPAVATAPATSLLGLL